MKIAYIMSRFPLISETFILREMIEVESLEHDVRLYPLICQDQPVVHKEAEGWIKRANCTPFISSKIITDNLRLLGRNPQLYFSLVWEIIKGNFSAPGFLVRALTLFPKAVHIARRLQEEKVDHIHAHYATHPALVAWIIHRITGLKYSVTIHSHDIYDCHAMLEPKLKGAVFLAPISRYNVDYLANLLGDWIREKCHVVRCGVSLEKFKPSPSGIKEGGRAFEILQVGSLHWKKGQVQLIQAIALLRDRGVPLRLRIIGEGKERDRIAAEIVKHNLSENVELIGALPQDEIASLYPTADCYVQSSLSEGIPVAIMEALACELPVLATRITGIPELVLDEETGYLVPPGNPQALADAIYKVWNEPEKARQMGIRGRQWVQQEFEIRGNVRKLVRVFEGLHSDAPASPSPS